MVKRKPRKRTDDTKDKKGRKPTPAGGRRGAASGDRPTVRVRMYRHGLGDCFLLTFTMNGEKRHVLIDFGTLGSSDNSASKVTTDVVAADIMHETGGKLELLIATHEHLDHLSGFPKLAAQLGSNKAEEVWLAWTEKPGDPLAGELAGVKLAMGTALLNSLRGLRALDAEGTTAGLVEGLLGFFGHSAEALDQAKPPVFQAAVNDTMDFLRKMGKAVEYREPGQALELASLPGFRFYILGPPRDLDAIHDAGEKGSSQLYGLATLIAARRLGFIPGPEVPAPDPESECPFDRAPGWTAEDHRIKAAFQDSYFNPEEDWRRVDSAWLGLASDLALKLDKLTNNTSLAIAIERICDGKVLLFPGDAQQGNWLSWHGKDMKWTVPAPGGSTKSVTARDLLAQTVFYKVGHHSSHNATLRDQGLELMKSPELTAFIPVDRKIALNRSPKGSWRMPARQLYARLLEKCNGRVMRSDGEWAVQVKQAKKDDVEAEFVGIGTDENWQNWRAAQKNARHVIMSDSCIDYLLE